MIRTLIPTFAALITLLLTSCGGGRAPLGACIDNGDCAEGEACILEVCEPVQCLASSDCNLREYCDTETYVCRAGCSEDTDCSAGEACNTDTNTCEEYGCRDTQLDCGIGEICSAVTGQCERDPADHCGTCEPDLWGGDPRGTCRDPNAFCLAFEDDPRSFCFLECDAGQADQCPRGYQCVDLGQDFDLDGQSDATCFAYCPLFYDNGWM